MKQDERKALIGKYILLILGSVLILVPLLATLFSSFKPTKDIVDNFFGFPTNFTWTTLAVSWLMELEDIIGTLSSSLSCLYLQ